MRQPLAKIAREALGCGTTGATANTCHGAGPVVADVWTENGLGFVLLVHRRDDGHFAEELFYSLHDPSEGAGTADWADCDHLSGGLLGVDPQDPQARAEILAGRDMAIVTESESLVHTRRLPEDDGDELVRTVQLLIAPGATALEVENLTRHTRHCRPVQFPLALIVLLPGDRLRVRAVTTTEAGHETVSDHIEL
ncbi:hypothetical protein, partial [Streptomyces candidus]